MTTTNDHRLRRGLLVLAAAGLILPATTVWAQGQGKVKVKKHRKEAKDHRKEAREHGIKAKVHRKRADELREKGRDRAAERHEAMADRQAAKAAEHRAKQAGHNAKAADARLKGLGAGGRPKRPELPPEVRFQRIKDQALKRRKDRQMRATKMRERARRRARGMLRGQQLSPAYTQEMRRHARRSARLVRIQTLAAEAGNIEVVRRVDTLLIREKKRHMHWLIRHTRAGDRPLPKAGAPGPVRSVPVAPPKAGDKAAPEGGKTP